MAKQTAWVVRDTLKVSERTGKHFVEHHLEETDWRRGCIQYFSWLEDGPFVAVAGYENGLVEDGTIHLPVLWRGPFHPPRESKGMRRKMEDLLVEDERWVHLRESFSGPYYPGMVALCSDRVSAVMTQRHLQESKERDEHSRVYPAIVDVQLQVVQAMVSPSARWASRIPTPRAGSLGKPESVVQKLCTGPYWAVNGKRSWRVFQWVARAPGSRLDQIAEGTGLSLNEARHLLPRRVRGKRVMVERDGGYYLTPTGRGLLAASEGVATKKVKQRHGIYLKRKEHNGKDYRELQRLHNEGVAQTIIALSAHGFQAFSGLGVVIDAHGGRVRVAPDAYVVLRPGVLVAVEFELSAVTPSEVDKKAERYRRLAAANRAMAVLFVTETEQAAVNFCLLERVDLLATTLQKLERGPQGKAMILDGVDRGDPGCWGYQYRGSSEPVLLRRSTFCRSCDARPTGTRCGRSHLTAE